jgi:hypothetical protein
MSADAEAAGAGAVAKRMVTAVLLAFVGVSVVYALAGGGCTTPQGAAAPAVVEDPAPAGRTVIAYYFHGDVRCDTCRKLEAYSRATIEARFADELAAGALQWRLVNVDEAENEHFIDDYGLYTRSLVLSEVVDGREARWKNLDRIWELVGDRLAYDDYVRTEVAAFLKES